MDVVHQSGIKIPNAVIVSGLTEITQGEEVLDYLKTHGTINRVVPVDDSTSEFHNNLIVEYTYGTALPTLEPHLPYTRPLLNNPDVTYCVSALASVYTQKVGNSATQSYLAELKGLAKLSGKDFEQVLTEMLSKITESVTNVEPREHATSQVLMENPAGAAELDLPETPHQLSPAVPSQLRTFQLDALLSPSPVLRPETLLQSPPAVPSQPHVFSLDAALNLSPAVQPTGVRRVPISFPGDFNPPEVQKVVVEHIVKNEDKASHMHSPVRLRTFSGKIPRPNSESDYDTWRFHVELIMTDPAISDLQRSRKILESLLPPAADVIKHLIPGAPPTAYLQLVDSAFGTVEDGEELFAQFMNTLQDPGEKPSAYLQRLQVTLRLVVKRGGITAGEMDKQLLKQLCRGCWDNTLLADLQLERKKNNPPPFAELLLMLRTEEDRQAAKVTRMRKHLGATKPRVVSHSQSVCAYGGAQDADEPSAVSQLKKQVAELQSQLATLTVKRQKNITFTPKGVAAKTPNEISKLDHAKTNMLQPCNKKQNTRPKPGYCFHCGEDGHLALSCDEDANPALVAEKRHKLRVKQREWEAQNGSSNSSSLNSSQSLLRDK